MDDLERVIRAGGRDYLLRIETSAEARDYEKYERLRNAIWGYPQDNLPGSRNLMCENFLHDGGSLFIAVQEMGAAGRGRPEDRPLVGFSYGFVGVKDKAIAFKRTDNLRFYSQYTGVLGAHRGAGLGVAIKEFQREAVRRLFGIETITCTYDPLTGVNARRNIHYFGMAVEGYRVSTYGEYGGLLNRLDVPSDRFFMAWDLKRPAASAGPSWAEAFGERRCVVACREEVVAGRSGPLEIEVLTGIEVEPAEEIVFARIPRDFYAMLRETDVDRPEVRGIPVGWRAGTRRLFLALLAGGYVVADFYGRPGRRPENYYVLRRTGAGP